MTTHDIVRTVHADLPADGLCELLDGDRVGLVVEGAFDRDHLASAVERLEDPAAGFEWTPQQHWDASVDQFVLLGESLTPNMGRPDGPDAEHYLAAAARFRRDSARVFAEFDLEEALVRTVAPLAGGRPLRAATAPDGRLYTPATIRRLPTGTAIPMHCGGFFLETPAYAHLRDVLDITGQLSWFVPLQTPEAGGHLQVTDLAWQDPAVPRLEEGFWDAPAIHATRECTSVVPQVGDMVVFDGGRWFHHVSPVVGPRTRWTVGGFLGLTKDRDAVLYWN